MGSLANLNLLHWVILALAALALIMAAAVDARHYRIPNMFSLILLLLFPLYVLTASTPVMWEKHLVVFALMLLCGFALYAKNIAGAGDIKLLAVTSLWAGPEWFLVFLFITSMTGGLLALAMTAHTYWQHRRHKGEGPLALAKVPIPYGVAIAMGGLCTLIMMSQRVPPSA